MSPLFRAEEIGNLTVEPDIGRSLIISVPHPNPEVMMPGEANPGARLDEAEVLRLRDLCDEALA